MTTFEPGYIGKVKIKNRLVMSPMNTHFSIGDPAVLSERYFEYYKARGKRRSGTYNYNPCKGGKKH